MACPEKYMNMFFLGPTQISPTGPGTVMVQPRMRETSCDACGNVVEMLENVRVYRETRQN